MSVRLTLYLSTTVKTICFCRKIKVDLYFFISWGIRQISGFTIGDWRYSKVENPLWHKMALTWPVDAAGDNIPVSRSEMKMLNFY